MARAPLLTAVTVALAAAVPGPSASADDGWRARVIERPVPVPHAPAPADMTAATVPRPAAPTGRPTAAPRPAAPGIERGDLPPASVPPVEDAGPLPEAWRGLDVASAAALLGRIPQPPRSPALVETWRRLLTAPSRVALSAPVAARFTAFRADALQRAGHVGEATAVAAGIPTDADATSLAVAVRIAVSGGDEGHVAAGCEQLRPLLPRKADLPRPDRSGLLLLAGYCAARAATPSAASLSAELIREERLDDPAALHALDAAASGRTTPARATATIGPVHYRLHAMAGGLDAADVVAHGAPALLALLATDRRTPGAAGDVPASSLRMAAAEAAARAGVLPAATLADVYRALAITATPAAATATAAAGSRPTAAALFVAAESERTPLRKVRHMRAFLDDARRTGTYWSALAVLAPVEATLVPVPEIGWFAETGIEIALVAGDAARARTWAALGGSVPGDGGLRHWLPLIDLIDPAAAGTDAGRSPVPADAPAVRGRLSPEVLHRLATVLEAVDAAVPATLAAAAGQVAPPAGAQRPRTDLPASTPASIPAMGTATGVLAELGAAAADGHVARTVMLALVALGPAGPDGADAAALGATVRALRRVGLDAEARRVALEALFTRWPRGVAN
jgi:hypothetical protein